MKIHLMILFFLIFTGYSASAQDTLSKSLSLTVIEMMDLNGDGGISEFEARNEVLKDYKRIDSNKDGFINEPEMEIYLVYLRKKAGKDKNAPCYNPLITPSFE